MVRLDVAIVGGGPGGATTGALLKKYRPELEVAIFERERFPRDHVGESQLPPIGLVLEEMGCWEQVEAAGFPIKIGATYRWGNSNRLWDFEFLPLEEYRPAQRPRRFGAQERRIALQVDRRVYDQILLRHAEALGCRVHEQVAVAGIERDGDAIVALRLRDGSRVQARHYVDASGGAGVLRRALGVAVDAPTRLQNVAFWDYWRGTRWPTQFQGEATRVLVLSIGCGWIWFIPIGHDRTSIGFICPASWYKQGSRSPEQLYHWALAQEPLLRPLLQDAEPEGKVRATRDWSFLAERMAGENWLLVGEACGFADPILAAGLTLTHTSAREAAYTLLALDDGQLDPAWLRRHYELNQRTRIHQHIRFADLWYSANGVFSDLQEYTREIARDSGLELDARQAFQWLATGGFTHDVLGQVGIGGLDLTGVRQVARRLLPGADDWMLSRYNRFRLRTADVQVEQIPSYADGRIAPVRCLVRGTRRLPVHGVFALLIDRLEHERDLVRLLGIDPGTAPAQDAPLALDAATQHLLQGLEWMLQEGWLRASLDPTRPLLAVESPAEGHMIRSNADLDRLAREAG